MSKSTGSKYKNIRADGFDSKKEKARYKELFAEEMDGTITDLQRQVPFEIIPKQDGPTRHERAIKYIADFTYRRNGELVVEDVKGYRGSCAYSLFAIKRKLMLLVHGIEVQEV